MEISGPTPLPSRANLDQVAQALSGWVLNNSKDGVSQLLGAPVPVFHSTHCEKKFPNLSLEFPFFQLVSIASHPFTFHLMLAKAAYTFWFWSECPYLWVMMVFHTLGVAMAIDFFLCETKPWWPQRQLNMLLLFARAGDQGQQWLDCVLLGRVLVVQVILW